MELVTKDMSWCVLVLGSATLVMHNGFASRWEEEDIRLLYCKHIRDRD